MKKIFLSLMCFVLMACTSQNESSKPKKSDESLLQIGIGQEFDSMNPLLMQMSAAHYVKAMVNRGLMTLNSQNQWIPQLIKEIPTLENKKARLFTEKGQKKIRADFEILENAKWGDGIDVTGHDVFFSWKTALLDTVAIGEREIYSQVEKILVDKKNPKKFSFIYKKAKWNFGQLGQFHIIPRHMEEGVVKKYSKEPQGYSKNSNYSVNLKAPGLYNGPYKITDLQRGGFITLEKNPFFFGKAPHFKKLIVKIIPNTATMEANLRSKTIDMLSFISLNLDQALKLKEKAIKQNLPYRVNIKPSLIYEHIDLNLKNPILKDIRVRKALVYAIDRDKLTKALFDGFQKKAVHFVSPSDPWFTSSPKQIVLYPTSETKAGKLLDEAGWLKKDDGFRYKNKKKLQFIFMTTSGNKTRELVQVFLKNQWKEVGIDVKIKNESAKVFFGETIKRRLEDKPTLTMYAWLSHPESSPRSQIHTESIPGKKNGFSGQNYPHWKNKEVSDLIEKLEVEFSLKKRKKIIAKILYHYTNEVPVIPLYYRSDISVTPLELKGYSLNGNQFAPTNFVERWGTQQL